MGKVFKRERQNFNIVEQLVMWHYNEKKTRSFVTACKDKIM